MQSCYVAAYHRFKFTAQALHLSGWKILKWIIRPLCLIYTCAVLLESLSKYFGRINCPLFRDALFRFSVVVSATLLAFIMWGIFLRPPPRLIRFLFINKSILFQAIHLCSFVDFIRAALLLMPVSNFGISSSGRENIFHRTETDLSRSILIFFPVSVYLL